MTKRKLFLPYFALIAFALAGFITIMTKVLPADLLPQIAASYVISDPSVG